MVPFRWYRSDGTVQIDTIQMVPLRWQRSDCTIYMVPFRWYRSDSRYCSDCTVQMVPFRLTPFRRYRSDGTVFLREEKNKTVGTKKAKTVAAILLVLALIIPI